MIGKGVYVNVLPF